VINVRPAAVQDVAELVRLRAVMLPAVDGEAPEPGPWQDTTEQRLRLGFVDGNMAAFVVAKPDRPHELAACVIGLIEHRLGSPANPHGLFGYVMNVATDPAYRRRGYSRACMEALLAWFEGRGVAAVDLHASRYGEPLYRSLGFAPPSAVALRRVI
jgi:GNAT superfamily N-acetyltransferase